MIYILSSTEQLFHVEIRVQQSRQGDSAASASLALSLKKQLSHEAFTEQQDYLSKAATAVYVSLNKIDQRNRFKASVQLTSNSQDFNFIAGSSSSGLGYALALFDAWWTTQLNKPGFSQTLYATGEISTSGEILGVGYVAEKINHVLAQRENQQQQDAFIICVPKSNENDLTESLRQRIAQLGGQLLLADRLQELLQQLLGDVYDGDPLGRWEAFKGLKSFEYEDSIRFFGRDKDIERLNNDLQNNQGVLIVSGQSGSGKSSLIKAGLIPYLEKHTQSLTWKSTTPKEIDGSLLVYVLNQLNLQQPQDKPLSSTSLAEMAEQVRQGKAEPNHLSAFFPDARSILLIHIDQFEEYYTSAQTQADRIELDRVHELTKQLPQLKVIVSIRNEYISILLERGTIKSPVISNVTGNLSLESWQEIIYEQAAFSGYTFEQQPEDLASIIIDHALKTPNALPMVEFLLEQIAEKAKDSATPNLLKHQDYETLGGLEGAIANRANASIDNHNQGQLHRFFSLFVATNNEGIAYARPVSYPADYIQQNTALNQLIQSLRNANILVAISDSQNKSYLKLAHDSLFTHWQTLKDWLAEQQRYLAWRNDIERSYKHWQQDQDKRHYLKDLAQRQEGLNYLKVGLIAEPDLVHYLQKSHSYANKRRFALLAIFLIPIMMIAGYFYDQNRIKVEYHTAITEKWSVPVGLHEITESQKDKRTGTYKIEYQGGLLRKLSYVNSQDVLTLHSEGWALQEYFYDDNGVVTKIISRNELNAIAAVQTILFDKARKEALHRFQSSTGKNITAKLNKFDDRVTGNGIVPQALVLYNEEGYSKKILYKDVYDRNIYSLNHHSKNYEYDILGRIISVTYLNTEDKPAANSLGAQKQQFSYDEKSELILKKDIYANSCELISAIDRDKNGNIVKLTVKNKTQEAISEKSFSVSSNGLIERINHYYPILTNYKTNPYIATQEISYDSFGRWVGQAYFDQKGSPIESEFKYFLPDLPIVKAHKIEYNRNQEGLILGSLLQGLNPDNFCQNMSYHYSDPYKIDEIVCHNKQQTIKHLTIPGVDQDIPIWKITSYETLTSTKTDYINLYQVNGNTVKVEAIKDERGYLTGQKYYLKKPDSAPDLIASTVFSLDEYGNRESEELLDQNGKKISAIDNFTSAKYKFNSNGKLKSISLVGDNDISILINAGYNKIKIEYDESETLILKEKEYNYLDQPIITNLPEEELNNLKTNFPKISYHEFPVIAYNQRIELIKNHLSQWNEDVTVGSRLIIDLFNK